MRDADADAVGASRSPLTADALASLAGEHAALAALAVTATATSTNSELLDALSSDPAAWPHMSAYVADHQIAGRGRAGRQWHTPQGASLTVSYVLRPRLERELWGLVPLVVGLACVKTLRADGVDAGLKWPNDVVVLGGGVAGDEVAGWGTLRKLAGILCEIHGDAVVAGIGVNVSQAEDELPVPHAASLATVDARNLDRAVLLDALSRHVAAELDAAERDPEAFIAAVTAVTVTVGMEVVVQAPDKPPVTGRAIEIAPTGALVVLVPGGERVEVHAGDVRLRSVT